MPKKFVFDEKQGKIKTKKEFIDSLVNLSFGVVNKMCDLMLVTILLGEAVMTSGGLAKNFARNASHLIEEYPEIDIQQWINGMRAVRRRKWVDASLAITGEGKERLCGLFPLFITHARHWDGVWHVIIFDIPESMRTKRIVLWRKLRALGFGKLQESVWISPKNFSGTVQKEIEELEIVPFVLYAKTTDFGEEGSKELATRVWKLDELAERYAAFFEIITSRNYPQNSMRTFFELLSILKDDPRLPDELLPKNWVGNEAYKYMQTFLKRSSSGEELGKKFFAQTF